MLFRKKLEGGLNALTEKNHKDEGPERPPLKSSMEKGDLFAMIMLVELKDCDISFPSLTAQLEAAGVELGMKVHLMHEDIFNAMHRI